MVFQVNYKYIHNNGKIRSQAIAVTADNMNDAKKKALLEAKKEYDHVEITSIKEWK